MQNITSREYKVMLDPAKLTATQDSLEQLREDIDQLARLLGLNLKTNWQSPEARTVTFYDTTDYFIRRSGYILRRRQLAHDHIEVTLKARNEDRYIADGLSVNATKAFPEDLKFEEDIAAPFHCRFSHSNTVTLSSQTKLTSDHRLSTFADAEALFPVFADLARTLCTSCASLPLLVVNGVSVKEQVFKGPRLKFPKEKSASFAVILWRAVADDRPLVAELSFRYKSRRENYALSTAQKARQFFEALQTLDWCLPESPTKTQFVYAEGHESIS